MGAGSEWAAASILILSPDKRRQRIAQGVQPWVTRGRKKISEAPIGATEFVFSRVATVAKGLVAEASDWPWSSVRTMTVDRWPCLCPGLIEQPLAASQPGQQVVPAARPERRCG